MRRFLTNKVWSAALQTISICLVLAALFIFIQGCKHTVEKKVEIAFIDGKPGAIIIPAELVRAGQLDAAEILEVHLKSRREKMLGKFGYNDLADAYLFSPVVPLTRGATYEILKNKQSLAEVTVPLAERPADFQVAIWPAPDTLPVNLLKFYITFTVPMREGEALDHVHLLNLAGDTLKDVFLDLQPELWNKKGTELTIWLDPGRIKRDLIPNKQLGNPLQANKQYKLIVSGDWKAKEGFPIGQNTEKVFFTGDRDEQSPTPFSWKVDAPGKGTNDPLLIRLNEPVDYFLIHESVKLYNEMGVEVTTTSFLKDKDQVLELSPSDFWKAGAYRLTIDAKLEDLAGNNLNRLFDRDLTKKQTVNERDKYELQFAIK